ncbi:MULTISPECIES: hypothetical protein [Terrabacteria group]|uniref:hypothetical protein n=1 Tax=Bacillati TaxID=1783272 RepID=UPI00193AAA41|nr:MULTISPECIES: hypothetical protein [Terrabacteria group]MBW9213008.1 hypothetical protein [Trueperella sp. zg.1013]QRG87050.1 hypothetical protein JOS54_01715 [Bulleidia sp. zg-1006]
MKYCEAGFRPFDHHFCTIPMQEIYLEGLKDYPSIQEADCLLSYGYIDHTAGFTFEVICAAKRGKDGYDFFDSHEEHRFFIRAQRIPNEEIEIVQDKQLLKRYHNKVAVLSEYNVADDIAWTRTQELLDKYRDMFFVDDIFVYFAQEGTQVECAWIRIEGVNGDTFVGTLLSEPDQDIGIHKLNRVTFISQKLEDNNLVFLYTGRG